MTESAPTRTAMESAGRHRAVAPVGRRDRSGRRLRVISLVGLGVGLLLAVPYGSTALRTLVWGGDPGPLVGVPASLASASAPPVSAGPTPSVSAPTGTPGALATPTPSATPRTSGSPAPSATESAPPVQGATAPTTPAGTSPVAPPPPPAPPQPVLLGPDGRDGVAEMMDSYCDRHVGGSWADARGDGGWECERLLLPSRTVDVDRACRDTYGDGAFAENPEGRDAYGWRCFRL